MDKNLHRISPENFNIPEKIILKNFRSMFDKTRIWSVTGQSKNKTHLKFRKIILKNKILNIEKLIQNKESKLL